MADQTMADAELAAAAAAMEADASAAKTSAPPQDPAQDAAAQASFAADANGTVLPSPPNPNLDKYNEQWKAVHESPNDFNAWTALITAAEKLDDIERLRQVFDPFLAVYPLCYGYWKKYADAEHRHQNVEAALAVYERGVAATPYSTDLWVHYANYKRSSPGNSPDEVRGIYERAVAYVGTDFNCHGLWDKYLQFEEEQGMVLYRSSLYSRIMACPIKELDKYWMGLQTFAQASAASDIMAPEELEAIRAHLLSAKMQAAAAAPVETKPQTAAVEEAAATAQAASDVATAVAGSATAAADGAAEAVEGAAAALEAAAALGQDASAAVDAATSVVEGAAEVAAAAAVVAENAAAVADAAAAKAVKAEEQGDAAVKAEDAADNKDAADIKAEPGSTDAEPMAVDSAPAVPEVSDDEIKASWLIAREEVYKVTRAELEQRRPFEEAIKRSYFHVKPLDAAQLSNWVKYLDYIEAKGDAAAIVTLYERCLVACASYPEFWERYVRCLEQAGMLENAVGALQRATVVYCKARPEIHLFAAHYEERHDNAAEARAKYKLVLDELSPRLLSAVAAAANFERRQGNREAACAYYEDLIKEEKAKEGSKLVPFLYIQYANFLRLGFHDVTAGRAALQGALEAAPTVKSIWEAAIFFEESIPGADLLQRVVEVYNRATQPPADGSRGLSDKEREELSQRCLDFIDMHGSPQDLLKAERQHAARFLLPAAVAAAAEANRKRHAPEAATPASADRAAKVARPEVAAAAAAAYPATPIPVPMAAAYPPAPAVTPASVPPPAYYHTPPAASAAQYPPPYYGYQQPYAGYGGYTGYGY